MTQESVPDRQQLLNEWTERAARDPQFRQELQRDPKGVVERELGVQLPANMQISVLEESPDQMYLLLPQRQAEVGALSDEQLESVAGGWSATCNTMLSERSCCHGFNC
jgi:hypothetical protein